MAVPALGAILRVLATTGSRRAAAGGVLESAKLTNAKQITAALSGGQGTAASTAGKLSDWKTASRAAAEVRQRTTDAARATKASRDAAAATSRESAKEAIRSGFSSERIQKAATAADRLAKGRDAAREAIRSGVFNPASRAPNAPDSRPSGPTSDTPVSDAVERIKAKQAAMSEQAVPNAKMGAAAAVVGAAGTAMAVPALTASLGLSIKALQGFTEGLLAGQEDLRQFDARIANTFASSERQQSMLAMQTARATGGSTSQLGEGVKALRADTQPMREAMVTLKNTVGYGLTRIASLSARLFMALPWVKSGMEFLREIEKNTRGDAKMEQNQYVAFLNDLAQPRIAPRKNVRPGGK